MHHRRCWAWIQSQGTFGCLGNRLGSCQTFGFHGVQVEHIAGLLRRENTNESKPELKNSSICTSMSQHVKFQPAPCLRRSAAVLVLVVLFSSWSSPTRSETAEKQRFILRNEDDNSGQRGRKLNLSLGSAVHMVERWE